MKGTALFMQVFFAKAGNQSVFLSLPLLEPAGVGWKTVIIQGIIVQLLQQSRECGGTDVF
jgi:hypothetical protein